MCIRDSKYVNVIGDTTAPTATWFQPDETTNSKFIAQVGGVTDKSGVKSVLFEVWNCSAGDGSAKQYAGVNTASGVWDATVDISKLDVYKRQYNCHTLLLSTRELRRI